MTKLLNIIVLHVHETRLEKSYKEPRVYETDILTREAPTFSKRKRGDGTNQSQSQCDILKLLQ